jgi:acetyl esterase
MDMPYAFDPELLAGISQLPQADPTDYLAARDMQSQFLRAMPLYESRVPVEARDVTIPGPPESPDVAVRIYAPPQALQPLPAVVYIHGGGFTVGNVAMFDTVTRQMAAEVGAVVVSVDHRLAPENPYPAAVEDCYAALSWTARSAHELGIDATRIAVCGGSAGGGLAAAVALLARDRGGPALCFQFLGIPELDDRLDTPSMRAYLDTPLFNRPAAEFSWDCYLGGLGIRGTSAVSPYAAPARAEDLSGLPAAFVTAAQFDPLRDEGIDYAQRLAQANVPTELILYPGTFHGSTVIAQAAISRREGADALDALRRALTGSSCRS